jgi:hypothetical protein
MQIQPSSAASAAAGTVSQATSKDRGAGTAGETIQLAATNQIERVARSEAASADRDAQGGGAGLGRHGSENAENTSSTAVQSPPEDLPVAPPEPPSQLDIVG